MRPPIASETRRRMAALLRRTMIPRRRRGPQAGARLTLLEPLIQPGVRLAPRRLGEIASAVGVYHPQRGPDLAELVHRRRARSRALDALHVRHGVLQGRA